MKGILSLDYIEKPKETIYSVRASWPDEKYCYAFPLYQENSNGSRIRKHVHFKKNGGDEIQRMQPEKHYVIYRARELYKDTFKKIPEEWKTIGRTLENIVGENNLAIIGSWLIGFTGKDVDFAVYGLDSLKKILKNLHVLMRFTKTLHPPLKYQQELMSTYRHINSNYNTTEKFILRRFYLTPKRQIEGSTLRFVLKQSELPLNPYHLTTIKKVIIKEGIIRGGEGSHFYPRFFTLETKEQNYLVVSTLHAHQSAVENGEWVRVRGELKRGNIIFINNPTTHGIYIL